MAAFKKTVKKIARKARGKLIKRYFKKGYRPKMGQIIKDVSALKKMVNAEKKRLTINSSITANTRYNNCLGQLWDDGSGYMALDITPVPSQGSNNEQRNGSSIKWHSFHMDLCIYHQSACEMPLKLEFYFVSPAATEVNITSFPNVIWMNNSFVNSGSVYDTYSRTNPDNFGKYKIISKRTMFIKEDTISSGTILKDYSIGMKFKNRHVRFNGNSNTVNSGQLLLIILCSGGNAGANLSNVYPVPMQTARSGLHVNWTYTNYYYDN